MLLLCEQFWICFYNFTFFPLFPISVLKRFAALFLYFSFTYSRWCFCWQRKCIVLKSRFSSTYAKIYNTPSSMLFNNSNLVEWCRSPFSTKFDWDCWAFWRSYAYRICLQIGSIRARNQSLRSLLFCQWHLSWRTMLT